MTICSVKSAPRLGGVWFAMGAVMSLHSPAARGHGELAIALDEIEVVGRRMNLVGEAVSASEGSIGQEEIANRPLQRVGDLLEFVPGLVATQHSGSGKANQYFLRGFNLDHGTDFATSVDAMPVNMRTHGHGQGWTDLNFLIPETVQELSYQKGPYYAEVGDFASTGSARFHVSDRVARGQALTTVGEFGYRRGVLVDSAAAGSGDLLYSAELQTFDGPWTDLEEDVKKANLLLRYSADVGGGRAQVMLMGYDNAWRSRDQIPQRAVDAGLISPYGSIDTSVGGESSRYSISGGWHGAAFSGQTSVQAYLVDSSLALTSNFTYLLDDPENGDQFEQVDKRRIAGFEVSQQWQPGQSWWRIGAEGRYDDIREVGLFRTREQSRLSTLRKDAVEQSSLGVFVANQVRINDQFRTYLGARYDHYYFDVNAVSLPINSGTADSGTSSLKASLIWLPMSGLELYASCGQGFHSNDARGTTIRVDPASGEAVDAVDPLVDSAGAELGVRVFFNDRWHATAAAWGLKLDSELLFVGDAGTTEASRPSRREGFDVGVYWFGPHNVSADIEASYTRARFSDADPAGNDIPGAIPLVVSAGIAAHSDSGWMMSARLRHFGAYPLIEDSSKRSAGSTLVNLRAGKEWDRLSIHLEVLNVFNSRDHDIDYYYASRLEGESVGGVEDVHFQIFQPRNVRLSLRFKF